MIEKIKSVLKKTEPEPVWVKIAKGELGVKEVRGGENPRILEYFKATTLHATEDEVSWCSAFINFIMKAAGRERSHSAAARSWLSVHKRLPGFKKYAVVILKRGNSSWQGHVGLAMEDLGSHIRVLGGNQSDMVCYRNFPKTMVLGYVWPEPDKDDDIKLA